MSLLAEQHAHAERLRRLALRQAGTGDVEVPGFIGAFARRLYGAWVDDPTVTSWVYSEGAKHFTLPYTRVRSDELIDGPLYVGVKLSFRYPSLISASVDGPAGTIPLWSGAAAPADVDLGEGGSVLGGDEVGGNSIATRFWAGSGSDNDYLNRYAAAGGGLPSDHFGDPTGVAYPRFRRFREDVTAHQGLDPTLDWKLSVTPEGGALDERVLDLGIDPPVVTVSGWGVRFAEDFGDHFTPGSSSGLCRFSELLAASDGFALADDGRSIVIPANAGGLYRAVGSVEFDTVAPDEHSAGYFPRGHVRILGTGMLGAFPVDSTAQAVGAAAAPGDHADPSGASRAQASALLQIPDDGGIVSLAVDPAGEVDPVGEAQTGNVTDIHVRNAHLGVYRWFV